jgi:hypothetical protein
MPTCHDWNPDDAGRHCVEERRIRPPNELRPLSFTSIAIGSVVAMGVYSYHCALSTKLKVAASAPFVFSKFRSSLASKKVSLELSVTPGKKSCVVSSGPFGACALT